MGVWDVFLPGFLHRCIVFLARDAEYTESLSTAILSFF